MQTLILLPRCRLVSSGGDLVADIPQILVEQALHSLLQDFYGRPHGADNPASDDALGELEVVEAENLHAFVEVQQALGGVVQPEEFFVTTIKLACGYAGAAELFVKSLAEARANV